MYSPTYLELSTYLMKELDLEDETFITSTEMMSYFNEGVDMVEAAIHTIYEDYFLTKSTLSFVNGTQTYSMPTDIYAQKVRMMLYENGAKKYPIRRIKNLAETQWITSTADHYGYIITNDGTNGLKFTMYPTPAETGSYVTLWYIRNAKRFTTNTDVCDIPEFTNVVVQFVRWKCLSKEGHPDSQISLQDLERLRQEMVDTLTARVPDEDNEVIKDFSFYNDFDDYISGGYY